MYFFLAHLADVFLMLFYDWHVGVVFVLRILRVTEFSKVRKSSAQRKIMKVLSLGKLKYNITRRNLSDTVISTMIFFCI